MQGASLFWKLSSRKGEEEGSSPAFFGLHPDSPAVTLDNLLTYGQANASAFILGAVMQAFEDAKHQFRVFRADTDPLVSYTEPPQISLAFCSYLDHGRRLAVVLERVPNQVLKELQKVNLVHKKSGQSCRMDTCSCCLNGTL